MTSDGGQRSVHWQNWNGSLSANPELAFYPETVSDVIAIVQRAKAEGKKIRVAGQGHTLSPMVPTNDFMVFMLKMSKIEVDKSDPHNLRVIAEPGALVAELDEVLRKHGVALPSNVVPTRVQLGGIVSLGAHGSGVNQPQVSDYVESVDIVTASGELRTFSEEKDGPEMMRAVRVNLGLFGIICRMTLRVERTFHVHVIDSKPPVHETMNNIEAIVQKHYFVDIYWMPFNDRLWMKTFDKVEAPALQHAPDPSSMLHKRSLEPGSLDGINNLVVDLMLKYPEITPTVCQALQAMNPVQDTIQDITTAIHYESTSPIMKRMHDTSFGFPAGPGFENVKKAFFYIVNRVEALAKEGKYPLNFGVEVRFLRGSEDLLSFVGKDGPTCVMEMASFRGTSLWPEFRDEVSLEWLRLTGGRPTWSKEYMDIPGIDTYIRNAYGESFLRFKKTLETLDPGRMFANGFLEKLFYPTSDR